MRACVHTFSNELQSFQKKEISFFIYSAQLVSGRQANPEGDVTQSCSLQVSGDLVMEGEVIPSGKTL